MMKKMRKITKSVMWFVVVAFVGTIIFAWGMDLTGKSSGVKPDVIATVNDQEISVQGYNSLFENRYKEAEQSYGELTQEMVQSLRDQTFLELINQALLLAEVKKRKITVTDKELFEFLRRNPPRELIKADFLQTDGQFDYGKYMQLLANPTVDWTPYENFVRSTIAQVKLQELVVGMARVTPQDVKRNFLESQTKLAASFIMIPASEFENKIQISQTDIKNYYEQNQEKYKEEPRASLAYVLFSKTASAEDEQKVKNELLDLRKKIAEGTDFVEIAIDYSEDPGTSSQGGDLGWFASGAMVKPFEEALLKLKPGQISEPVKTDFGWHLIKLHGTKKEEGQAKFHASHILLSLKPSQETLAKIKAETEQFSSQSKKVGFEKLAGQKQLSVVSTGLFKKNDFLKDLGSNSPAHAFAFEAKVGQVSPAMETPSGFAVCKLVDQKPAGIKSLDEMQNFLAKELNGQKSLDLAFQKATQIYLSIKPGQSLSQVANAQNLKLSHTGTFTFQDISVSGVGISPEFQGVAFALTKENPISKPVRGKFGAYIIELASKEAPPDSVFPAMQDSLTNDLLSERQAEIYNQWLSSLKRQAKIQDYRQQQAVVEEENL